MNENLPSFEIEQERIPSLEDVLSIFDKLTEEKYKEVRRLEDEKGLYLLEIVVPGDLPDEITEYAYMRKGRHKEGQISETGIHATFYENNMPISGKEVARYVEEKWEIL